MLVHECTFDESMEERAILSGHSTSKSKYREGSSEPYFTPLSLRRFLILFIILIVVGEFAQRVKPKTLIITHFSQRYTGEGVSPNVDNLLHETKLYSSYKNTERDSTLNIDGENDNNNNNNNNNKEHNTTMEVFAARDFLSFSLPHSTNKKGTKLTKH